MKVILTPEEMNRADKSASDFYKIPPIILMENAARSASEYIENIINQNKTEIKSLLILCGSGNNGGDGFALSRHLFGKLSIKIYLIGNPEKMSLESTTNYKSAQILFNPVKQINSIEDIIDSDFKVDCIIDAMIGTGGTEELRGLIIPVLKNANNSSALRIALDIPTGLNAGTGIAHEDCFKANHTITMGAMKTGLLINDGIEKCGEIFIADLGAPKVIYHNVSKNRFFEPDLSKNLIFTRKKVSSKFDYGKVMIIAGSKNMPGAAALAANAAITAGAGLVYLFTPLVHSSVLPEVITNVIPANESGTISLKSLDALLEMAKKVNVVAIGPGLGNNKETIELVSKIIESVPKTVTLIIDGDALNAISNSSFLSRNIILTPHIGEFSRITGLFRETVAKNAHILAVEWANKLNCTMHLKHVPSITTNGIEVIWTLNGNPGMATAGSGDVLTGIIAGIEAQIKSDFMSAAYGSYFHAASGDYFVEKYSRVTLTASELVTSLKEVIK